MRPKTTSTERKALLYVLLSCAIFMVWGSILAADPFAGLGDFKTVFYATRCLMQHGDPYNPAVLLRVHEAAGNRLPADPEKSRLFQIVMLKSVNLPTSLLLVAPLALLPWWLAGKIWLVLTAVFLSLAALLVWRVTKDRAPRASTLLICLLLCNSELILATGNLAGIVAALCVFGAWCFLEERFEWAGIVCMGISLVLKPHDTVLVWFYFLLAGGIQRKRALQTLGLAAALAVPAILWVSTIAPQWLPELHSNVLALGARGSINDPGPGSLGFHTSDYVISLQAALSLFKDDPHFYNLASYLTCGVLLCAGAARVIQSRFTKRNGWIALAAIAAFSMLPVYHRSHDAKLLLLTVPACTMLWAGGGRLKWVAGLMTSGAIVCTSDVFSTIIVMIVDSVTGHLPGMWRNAAMILLRPAPLILLATGIFYLWVYFRRTALEQRESAKANDSIGLALATGS